jgi:hypothetical protein
MSGKKPSHPELIDWLAVEFMERNWDMKAIHKLIVTSSAYKLRSSGWSSDSPQAKADPENVALWRMNTRRMEAEVVRDSVLSIAGKLDTTMGGPEIDETKGHEIFRRSLYFRHAPDLQMDMLKVFDAASPNECFERGESIVPQQALALANGKLSLTISRLLARQLSPAAAAEPVDAAAGNRTAVSARGRSDEEFVTLAFDRILGRKPSAAESGELLTYLRDQTAFYRDRSKLTPFASGPEADVKPAEDPAQRARESLVHVLLNHNDFVTIR